MRVPTDVLDIDMKSSEALDKVTGSPWNAWPVVDSRGLVGMVRDSDLREAADTEGESTLREALDFKDSPHLHDDHLRDLALERMGASGMNALPVVSRLDVRRMDGIVGLPDVMRVYGFSKSDNS